MSKSPSKPVEEPHSYGCQEFRDDAERILTSRFDSFLETRFEAHRATCYDCRRFHHRLQSVYRGPIIETRISQDPAARDRQFERILKQTQQLGKSKRDPADAREHRRLLPAFVRPMALAGVGVAGLALGWTSVQQLSSSDEPAKATQQVAIQETKAAPTYPKTAAIPSSVAPKQEDPGALGHASQRFGRVISGHAKLARNDQRTASPGTFRVGTTIDTAPGESVQFALSGKMLVSLTGNSRLSWSHASKDRIALKLDRGMMAVRYDRKPGEPTLLVHSRSALVKVVGTVFTVEMTNSGDTSVSVLRGKVQVKDRRGGKTLANVSAGKLFDTENARLGPLGAHEVAAALPLSDNSAQHEGDETIAQIPSAWTVPGLSDKPRKRTLSRIPSRDRLALNQRNAKKRKLAQRMRKANKGIARPGREPAASMEEDAIHDLVEQAANSIQDAQPEKRAKGMPKEVLQAKAHCTALYNDPATRFLAANCLQSLLRRFPNQPRARAEALVAIGILRMDYARDHQRAIRAFESFLKDYSNHRQAELVRYRLVLAHIEAGDIQAALSAAKSYVKRFPNGPHLGHVIQRFPELKSMI